MQAKEPTLDVIGYCRVSRFDDTSQSLESQRRAIESWALAHGGSIIEICSDEGVSGAVNFRERPAGSRAFGLCYEWSKAHGGAGKPRPRPRRRRANDPIAVRASATSARLALVTKSMDRLGRNALDSLAVVEALPDGCGYVAIDQGIDTGGPLGKLSLTLWAAIAEMELGAIRERNRGRAESQIKRGRKCAPKPPYGYDHGGPDGLLLVENPEEQNILGIAFALLDEGIGYGEAARRLNEMGKRRRCGGRWCRHSLRAITMGHMRRLAIRES